MAKLKPHILWGYLEFLEQSVLGLFLNDYSIPSKPVYHIGV